MATGLSVANSEIEWKTLLASKNAKIVRSKADWVKLLRSPGNPLAGADPNAIAQLTKSLKFKNGGLVHAEYALLSQSIPHKNFMELWAAFGIGARLMADHEGYSCSGRANCSKSMDNICMSGC